jgi:hypothetical protein
MNKAVSTQHPGVLVRFIQQHLRALLTIAIAGILGLTVAIVVSATNGYGSVPGHIAPTIQWASRPSATAEAGAKLDHRDREGTAAQARGRLAN